MAPGQPGTEDYDTGYEDEIQYDPQGDAVAPHPGAYSTGEDVGPPPPPGTTDEGEITLPEAPYSQSPVQEPVGDGIEADYADELASDEVLPEVDGESGDAADVMGIGQPGTVEDGELPPADELDGEQDYEQPPLPATDPDAQTDGDVIGFDPTAGEEETVDYSGEDIDWGDDSDIDWGSDTGLTVSLDPADLCACAGTMLDTANEYEDVGSQLTSDYDWMPSDLQAELQDVLSQLQALLAQLSDELTGEAHDLDISASLAEDGGEAGQYQPVGSIAGQVYGEDAFIVSDDGDGGAANVMGFGQPGTVDYGGGDAGDVMGMGQPGTGGGGDAGDVMGMGQPGSGRDVFDTVATSVGAAHGEGAGDVMGLGQPGTVATVGGDPWGAWDPNVTYSTIGGDSLFGDWTIVPAGAETPAAPAGTEWATVGGQSLYPDANAPVPEGWTTMTIGGYDPNAVTLGGITMTDAEWNNTLANPVLNNMFQNIWASNAWSNFIWTL
jgi:hypothetical protein